jgi:hypothetical protein
MERIVMGCRRMIFVGHVVVRKLCGGKLEKLTGGWREL